jgi:Domain of unknown function (DUF4440)
MTTPKKEVNDLENKWSDALRVGCQPPDIDTLVTAKRRKVIKTFLKKTLANNYTNIDHLGVVRSKAEDLINCGNGGYLVKRLTKPDKKTRIYGDRFAVVVGRDKVQATFKGKNVGGKFIWTDTWVKFGTQWKCVASHGSKRP